LAPIIMIAMGLLVTEPAPDARPIPPEFLSEPLQLSLNVGPAGQLPAAGCVGLVVTIGNDGMARTARISRSSREYPVDRSALLVIRDRYRFSVPESGVDEAQHWQVYLNYGRRGRNLGLANECRPPVDAEGKP